MTAYNGYVPIDAATSKGAVSLLPDNPLILASVSKATFAAGLPDYWRIMSAESGGLTRAQSHVFDSNGLNCTVNNVASSFYDLRGAAPIGICRGHETNKFTATVKFSNVTVGNIGSGAYFTLNMVYFVGTHDQLGSYHGGQIAYHKDANPAWYGETRLKKAWDTTRQAAVTSSIQVGNTPVVTPVWLRIVYNEQSGGRFYWSTDGSAFTAIDAAIIDPVVSTGSGLTGATAPAIQGRTLAIFGSLSATQSSAATFTIEDITVTIP